MIDIIDCSEQPANDWGWPRLGEHDVFGLPIVLAFVLAIIVFGVFV